MAGSIPLSLTQQFDSNGDLLSGGKLYSYVAGTTTPQNAYEDEALTQAYDWPIVLETNGRIPALYYANGTIRVRLNASDDVVQFDQDNIIVLGAASTITPPEPVDPNALFQTGDLTWNAISGTRSGWVRANARTIGSATSGGTERANVDCEDLFAYFWENFSDTLCPVSTGRGASAAADWAANKTIGTLDMRGRAPFGLGDMGNSDSGRLTGATFGTGNATTAASSGGTPTETLDATKIPSHTHTATVTDPGHTHTVASATIANAVSGGSPFSSASLTTPTTSSSTTGITVANSNTGGGLAHNNMPPFVLGSWYVRL